MTTKKITKTSKSKNKKKLQRQAQVKEFNLTPRLRSLYEILNNLTEVKKIVLKPSGFFVKKINIENVLIIHKEYSEAKANFWNKAIEEFPAIQGKNAEANIHKITLI